MNETTEGSTKNIRRDTEKDIWVVEADLCVAGAGMAGISAAVTAASAGKRVVLVDASQFLGGQTYNANIGCFGGFYSNDGENARLLTSMVVGEMFDDMRKENGIRELVSDTKVLAYDANIFLRWVEKKMQQLGVTVLLGAVIYDAEMEERRIREISAATRYGTVKIRATGYVDASGDAVLGWLAGLLCQTARETKVWGTQMMVLKGVDYTHEPPTAEEINRRAEEKSEQYHLKRTSNVIFYMPNRGDLFYGNMTHVETPMNPLQDSMISMIGRNEVDNVLEFLRKEFPETFGKAVIHHYVNTGIRQTRCISSVHQLTLEDLCCEKEFEDTVARTSWPIELHSTEESYTWDTFDRLHVHNIPLRCMLSPEADNYAAAGRCIDADVSALASVRVMGPCSATGTAAAHVLMMAGKGSVHEIDVSALQQRLSGNLTDSCSTVAN